jgi:hypothetical protein
MIISEASSFLDLFFLLLYYTPMHLASSLHSFFAFKNVLSLDQRIHTSGPVDQIYRAIYRAIYTLL